MQKNSKNATIIILLIILIVFIGILFTLFFTSNNSVKENSTVSLPQIEFVTYSNSDNSAHKIRTAFALDYNGNLSTEDKSKINDMIIQTLTEVDFDILSQEDGLEYAKDRVMDSLQDVYPDKVDNVFITKYLADVNVPSAEEKENSKNDVDEFLDGISKGFK